MNIVEVNAATGEVIEREATADERAQLLADEAAWTAQAEAAVAATAARQAALRKIAESSGLTTDDLTALGL